jgi:hypothetical protein
MLTHSHMVIYTWWCWHIYEGGGVWAVERGLGSSLSLIELVRRDSGVFEEIKWLFSFTPEAGRSGEVVEVVIAVLQATGAGREGDRRCPYVYRLTPGAVSRGRGHGRADTHVTNVGVSVCRSVFGGLASAWASDAAPRLSIDWQTCLSRLSGALERSGPRLSCDRRWSGLVSDASNAGSWTLDFERAVDTWRR